MWMRLALLAFVLFIAPFFIVRVLRPYAPFAIFGFILGVPWLFTRTPLSRWVGNRIARGEPRRLQDPVYALLRREVQAFGKQLEGLPYERLLDFDDTLAHHTKQVDGIEISFDSELISVEKNGDLYVSIDANAVVPGWKWRDIQPSYGFRKRKDGTVY